ncbi:hypothetical protein JZ751_000882 [Albula glossodonta]|uniref:Cysteine/serine-rich nuclear protein N-terminal domain-containing protein n=1 Tax=Albula glossodonta TaxID=121402 RepID=A0A8T2PXN9_9TELE|nr:hypothetical protein JZ751_000882 [Albula glossodonta]
MSMAHISSGWMRVAGLTGDGKRSHGSLGRRANCQQRALALCRMPRHASSILKKSKRARKSGVQFDHVTVFFFPRCQGFTSVPSRGGCTLGMVRQHSACRQYTLAEFALTNNGTRESEEAERLTVDDIPEEEVDVSGVDVDDGSFLHPYPSKRRHALLKAAGIKKIDKEEKRQLQQIRLSREDCGCDCQGFCEPETCACSLAGIKCQMDHSSFPCGCTKDGCGNTEGRIEFNSSRVQTHYIHTIMKLELEKRLEESSADTAEDEEEEEQEGEEAAAIAPAITPSFHFSPELASAGENSCCSDMTDSSSSSGQSEDEGPTPQGRSSGGAPLDVDDDGLARILSLNAADSEDSSCSSIGNSDTSPEQQQQPPPHTGLAVTDFLGDDNVNGNPPSSTACPRPADNRTSPVSSYLDENANQATALFHSSYPQHDFPNTPSPSTERSAKSYMDLSLSSDSDLEFFDSFPDYGPNPLYSSLKDYDHLDNFFHFQLPSYPSLPHASETGTCFLESLIGLSESVPEPPATFTDNQLLEEAIKSSMVEPVKV